MDRKTLVLTGELEFADESGLKEAFSAVTLNQTFQWAKIVVTDDQPNANKMKIPESEFDNLIKTGIHAPVKMAESQQKFLNHDNAAGKPIGVIAQLSKENNRIIALVALWKKERPDEVAALKESFKNGQPPQVSWEVSYVESSIDEAEVESLLGTSLDGLAVVSIPAYRGRTSFVAMSSESVTEFISYLGKIIEEEEISDEIQELLLAKAEEIIEKFSDKESVNLDELQELKDKVAELDKALKEKEDALATLEKEKSELAEFKNTVEAEKAKAEKLESIKNKFAEAKIEKDEDYFEKNEETLLALSEGELDFMIQEIVSFTARAEEDQLKNPKIPKIMGVAGSLSTPKEIAEALIELRKENKK